MNKIEDDMFFCCPMNSGRASKFVTLYHYSHHPYRGAKLNLGVFDKNTNELVGVFQWGENPNRAAGMNKYVITPIDRQNYYLLNRRAIQKDYSSHEDEMLSMSIQWIKQYKTDIKILFVMTGRVENNYGITYQHTGWKYIGSFVSSAFWRLDGREYHWLTLCTRKWKGRDPKDNLITTICKNYHDVRHYWSKQFIYTYLIDENIKLKKIYDEFPSKNTVPDIVIRQKIYKEDNNFLDEPDLDYTSFYYIENEPLSYRPEPHHYYYCVYNLQGEFEGKYNHASDIDIEGYKVSSIYKAIKNKTLYKNKYFLKVSQDESYPKKIEVKPICIIDEKYFYKMPDIVKYCNVSRQCVHDCRKHKGHIIGGKAVEWIN